MSVIPMPSATLTILPESKLLFVGTGEGISKVRKIIRKDKKPKELQYV